MATEFQRFKVASRQAAKTLGLQGWRLSFESKELGPDEANCRAYVNPDTAQMSAHFTWNSGYAKDPNDPLPGVYAGRHEAIHVLLAPVVEAAAKAGKADAPEVLAAEHALLNAIYSLVWDRHTETIKNR